MAGRRRGSTRSAAAERATVRIDRIGAEGDGIGALPDGRSVFVPLTLPGELVEARFVAPRAGGWAAVVDAVLESSADRVAPPCPHFGSCGGCVLQHWQPAAYRGWKSGLLRDAVRRAAGSGWCAELAPLQSTLPGTRRRMDLAVRRTRGKLVIGLHRQREMAVVDLTTCMVLRPELVALIQPLRDLLRGMSGLRAEGSVVANLIDSGPDLLLRTDGPLTRSDRAALIAFARAHDLPRLSWGERGTDPEPVCVFRPPVATLSDVTVTLPPGAFLQSSAAGEAAVVAAVLAGLPDPMPPRARITELFAGCGTLTFALARHGGIAAWEGNEDAVAALRSAARRTSLPHHVEARRRDLARQPLSAAELAGSAAIVLDPPHAGAAAQMPAIAAAGCSRVIYVSCNPVTLGRDARLLHAAGYRVMAATPIDQFLWSARLESVVVFGR